MRRVVQTWALDAVAFVEELARWRPLWPSGHDRVASGHLVPCGPGMYVNRVLGAGLRAPLTAADFELIEVRCAKIGVDPSIEITPVTHPDLRPEAEARGDMSTRTVAALRRSLDDLDGTAVDDTIVIEPAADELEVWQQTSALGWRAGRPDRPPPARRQVGRMPHRRLDRRAGRDLGAQPRSTGVLVLVRHHDPDERFGRGAGLASGAMLLREFVPSDLDAVHAINDGEVPAVGAESPGALVHIAGQSAIALVAEVDGEVAGFCFVLPPGADYGSQNYAWFAERYDDFVYLDRVAIPPRFQRRGIGRVLYSEVERLAADRRPTATAFTLEVNVRPRNDRSLAFHAELGFVEVGQRETDYGARVSMMAKPLAPS